MTYRKGHYLNLPGQVVVVNVVVIVVQDGVGETDGVVFVTGVDEGVVDMIVEPWHPASQLVIVVVPVVVRVKVTGVV